MDQEHKMKLFVQLHLIPALLAVIVFFTTLPFIESAMRLNSRAEAGVDWHGVKTITRVLKPGDTLEMIYLATINKQCPSDIRGFIVAPDGSVPVRFPTVAGGYTRPSDGPVEIRVRIPIPRQSDGGLEPLKSGEYIYRSTVTRYCPDGVEDDNLIPDVPFTLVTD
jgi:hypothetical protein